MDNKKKRLTLDLDPPLQRRLKAVTALKGISMRQYCQAAIEKELTKDEAQGLTALPFGQDALDRLEALQEQLDQVEHLRFLFGEPRRPYRPLQGIPERESRHRPRVNCPRRHQPHTRINRENPVYCGARKDQPHTSRV
jgi:hypothetical protein